MGDGEVGGGGGGSDADREAETYPNFVVRDQRQQLYE